MYHDMTIYRYIVASLCHTFYFLITFIKVAFNKIQYSCCFKSYMVNCMETINMETKGECMRLGDYQRPSVTHGDRLKETKGDCMRLGDHQRPSVTHGD